MGKFSTSQMKKESGQILVLAIVIVGLVLFNALLIIGGASIYSQNSNYALNSAQATDLAEAAVDKAIASLNRSGGSYNGESKTSYGPGQFSVNMTNKNPTTKIIKATASIPNEDNPRVKRTIQVEVSRGIGAAFNYGLQVGEGGLEMGFNSKVFGSVYSNGNITMTLNNEITGDAYVAGGVQPVPDQQSDCSGQSCADFIFGKNVSGADRKTVTQSFKPSQSLRLNKVAVKLKKTGTPSNLTVYLTDDNNGKPNFSNILANGSLSASLVTGNYGYVEVAFVNPPDLTAAQSYWLVLSGTIDRNDYWEWSYDNLTGYNRGEAKWSTAWSQNSIWNDINASLGFKTYMGGVATYIEGGTAGRILGNAHANTLTNLNVNGTAYYQVSSNLHAHDLVPGSPDPAVTTMPLSDNNIQVWKDLAASNGIHSGDITNCPTELVSGKYIGSLTPPDDCTILVESPIWITGDIILGNNTRIKLKPTYGSSSGALIADGRITMYEQDIVEGSGTSGSYIVLISEFNSQTDPEHRDAITVSYKDNNGVLYANRGIINIVYGNRLTSVTGWKLILATDTRIEYDEGLAGAFFSSGPSGAYTVIKGTYQIK